MNEKTDLQLLEMADTFLKWRGAAGQLVSYTPTGQILTLALWYGMPPDKGYMQHSFSGCTRINLPTRWSEGYLTISELPQAKQLRIEDPGLAILIVCSEASALPKKKNPGRSCGDSSRQDYSR